MSLLTAVILCNYLANPIGVHDPAPRLSWEINAAERRGVTQTAYQIKVSSQPNGTADLWDSGRIQSDQSTQVPYAGKPLPSRTRAYWQVTTWDDKGVATTSAPAANYWEMGLLQRSDWKAQWIGASWHGSKRVGAPAPYLRHRFDVAAKPVRARLYVTALGLYEAYLNGQRIGSDVFTPGWTDYNKRVQYQVYDVANQVVVGRNTMGAILGDGWYCGSVGAKSREVYGDRPKLLAQLELTYADGKQQIVTTDGSWQVARSPILENDLLMGESYDARQEVEGWFLNTGNDAGWTPVTVFPDPSVELSPMLARPVRAHESLTAKSITNKSGAWHSAYVYNFGQNLVGYATLRIKAPAGTTIKLRFAEMLDAQGNVYVENLRGARVTDYYTCKGDPNGETWTPKFTFHGFQYAEITGLPEGIVPDEQTLVAHVLHTELPETGTFSSSDPLLNQLQSNIQWGERGNYLEVPTDCPQRDERLGWTGDAQAFIRTGAWNREIAAFFTKWQRDLADAQSANGGIPAVIPNVDGGSDSDGGPAWADAAIICPWTIYQCYGDIALLAAHFPTFERYAAFLSKNSIDGIRLHPNLHKWQGFGDWLALDGSGRTEGGTPKDLIATAFHVHDLRLLAEMAHALGRTADAARYAEQAETVKKAFVRRFVTQDGLVAGSTQTSYVLALYFDLVPRELRPKLTAELVRDIKERKIKLSTGFVGTPYLLHVLSAEGELGLAYQLLFQKDWPSWLYAVTQGATTIWERWDGWTKDKGFQTPGMNSFNHYAYGAVGDWLYRVVAGIELDPRHPGYKHFFLQPQPGGPLTWAKATHKSMYGEISSGWKTAPQSLEWDVTVPPNTTATARFPVPRNARVSEGSSALEQAAGVRDVRFEGDTLTCELGSGTYRFRATW